MVSESKRAAIRKRYRVLRAAAEKTQLQVSAQARIEHGRYWKIENGVIFPTDAEREKLARVLKASPDDIPTAEQTEAA